MKRRLFSFRPEQTLSILFLFVALLFGCGGGGGGSGGTNPPPNNPPPGGGNPGTPNTEPPSVVSAVPQGDAVSVSASIEITFDKSMNIATFQGALEGLGNIGYEATCVDADCKTIRLSRLTHLEYNFTYTLKLLAQVRDEDGNLLASPYIWSFKTAPFIPPTSFDSGITVDGKTLNVGGDLVEVNTGECTALEIDDAGTVHIVYYSEFDGSPKHAFCLNGKDCKVPENWTVQFIEAPVQGQKRGRDINLAIDGDTLHVSYRDVDPPLVGTPFDDEGVLKYVKAVKSGDTWTWSSAFEVDDTVYGVTNTYIAVSGGSVHISYAEQGPTSAQDVLVYTTCPAPCDPAVSWDKIPIQEGEDAGAPNHIVVTGTGIHISYYIDGKFMYATCPIASDCAVEGRTAVIDEGEFDAGRENSLTVDANGTIHATYRVTSDGDNDLRYARCFSACRESLNWEKIAIDTEGRVGGSSQIKFDDARGTLHVSYRDDDNKDLMYATCASDCLIPSQWTVQRIDAPGDVGLDTYLDVGTDGTVHISYRAAGDAEDLKYAQGTP